MSWSTSTSSPIDKNGTEHRGVLPVPTPNLGTFAPEEAEAQFAAAMDAARLLALAVGRPTDQIHVSLTGHANPDHAPAEGWGDEFINVSVRVHRD